MIYMISINYGFMGKEVHVLSEAITLCSKAMPIVVIVAMFRLLVGDFDQLPGI